MRSAHSKVATRRGAHVGQDRVTEAEVHPQRRRTLGHRPRRRARSARGGRGAPEKQADHSRPVGGLTLTPGPDGRAARPLARRDLTDSFHRKEPSLPPAAMTVEELLRARHHLLPASPEILVRLQRMLDDGRSGAADIAGVLGRDPGLVAAVLRVVNSAFYGLPQAIKRLTIAVAYLGQAEIHRLVVATSIVNAFRVVDRKLLEPFWVRSHLTGLMARTLVRSRATWLSQSLGWTLGLLHDLGTLVRIRLTPADHARVMAYRAQHLTLDEDAELALDVVPTPIFGAALCRAWELPGPIELVIRSCRTGLAPVAAKAETAEYIRLIAAASLAASVATSPLSDEVIERVQSRVCQALDADDAVFWGLVAEARARVPEATRTVHDELMPRVV